MNEAASSAVKADNTDNNSPSQTCLFGSRMLDFWLIGGLAIVLWIPLFFLQEQSDIFKSLGAGVVAYAFYLAYFVNYPHFMASYKLAYTQGTDFVTANWFQLILVPLGLIGAILLGYIFWSASIKDSALIQGINSLFAGLGLKTRAGLYPNLGSEILGMSIVFMFFTVGWHYSKQTFGCMMVYAKLDGYRLNNIERNLIRYGLLSTWWLTWLYSNCSEGTYPFYNLTIHRLALPYVWFQIAYVITGLLFTGIVGMMIYKYVREQQLPSMNFLVPMIALLTWHIPLFGNPQYFYIIAFFHSLQYFPFVAKVEKTRYRKNQRSNTYLRLLGFFVIMLIIGYLSFDFVPNQLDKTTTAVSSLGVSFFLIAFLAFINIHHYFIDNVLWRFKNREVKDLLFG